MLKPLAAALLVSIAPVWAQEPSGDTGIRAADPSIIHTEEGFVAVESRDGRALLVRVAPTLQDLADAQPRRIWFDRDRLGEVWAPEIVQEDGRFVVYFAAGVGSAHRMYRIESLSPVEDYGDATAVALPENKWAIDGLAFTYDGTEYFAWSGWAGDTDVQQDIFIARMGANGKAQGQRTRIAMPDAPWENIARETPAIAEGPQPLIDPDGRLHVVYSVNGSWGPHYCLADLRLAAGADPLEATAWAPSPGCLFGANAATLAPGGTRATRAKGVGHPSFVLPGGDWTAANDAARPFVYHGVPAGDEPANFWAARRWFIGSYQWVPDVAYGGDTGWSLRFFE